MSKPKPKTDAERLLSIGGSTFNDLSPSSRDHLYAIAGRLETMEKWRTAVETLLGILQSRMSFICACSLVPSEEPLCFHCTINRLLADAPKEKT